MQISTRLCRQSHVTLLTILIVQKIQLFTPIPWHLNTVFFISCEPFTLISLHSFKNSFLQWILNVSNVIENHERGILSLSMKILLENALSPTFLLLALAALNFVCLEVSIWLWLSTTHSMRNFCFFTTSLLCGGELLSIKWRLFAWSF